MRYIKMLPRLLFLLPTAVFAGRSLVMTPSNQGGSINDPNLAQNQSWRVEFQMHDWTPPPAGNFSSKIFELDGVGAVVWLYPDGGLAVGEFRDTVTPAQPCFLPTAGHSNVVVRFQRDVSQLRFSCEIWNYDGTGYASGSVAIVNTNPYTPSGGLVAGGATTSLAYLRVFTTLVPMGSRPPTTADAGDWTELKFENNLNDSTGHGHSASVPGATYINTPNQLAISFPKTFGAPPWNNWTSLRAGYPAKLDGTASFSLADASSVVTYFWQQVSGPTSVRWSDRTAGIPTITGLIFGTYTFSLRVTDAAGSTSTVPLLAAAVATDDNGVVLPSDPNVEKVYGPMIAFGQNPWGYADERNLSAVTLQIANNPYPASAAQWAIPATGTVTYPFSGVGPAPGQGCYGSGTMGGTQATSEWESYGSRYIHSDSPCRVPQRPVVAAHVDHARKYRFPGTGAHLRRQCYHGRCHPHRWLRRTRLGWSNPVERSAHRPSAGLACGNYCGRNADRRDGHIFRYRPAASSMSCRCTWAPWTGHLFRWDRKRSRWDQNAHWQ